MMNILSAKNVQVSRNNITVIDNVDVTVNAKEFVGLIGPNGAGKSSLMRILAGLNKPDAGNVALLIDQTMQQIEKITPKKRAQYMAYLAQNETPAWPLSVKNLVALGRLPWNNNVVNHSHDDDVAIENALQMTELNDLSERPITALSGGELQRALLARVFAGVPQLILADEPIAALDIYHQLHTMELLQQHVNGGGTVVAALHDLSLAARFCSRLILLHKGKVVADGEPVKVLSADNIEQVYGVGVHVDCREDGVVIIPKKRLSV